MGERQSRSLEVLIDESEQTIGELGAEIERLQREATRLLSSLGGAAHTVS